MVDVVMVLVLQGASNAGCLVHCGPCIRGQLQLLQDGCGVFADRWHRVHTVAVLVVSAGRQQRRHCPNRGRHIGKALASNELWVRPQARHVVDMRIGNTGIVQPLYHLIGLEGAEDAQDLASGPVTDGVVIACLMLSRIANFDDLDPLKAEPGVHLVLYLINI